VIGFELIFKPEFVREVLQIISVTVIPNLFRDSNAKTISQ